MALNLFSKFKLRQVQQHEELVERVPLSVVITNLTTNYSRENHPEIYVETHKLSEESKTIITSLNLPFDISTAKAYIAEESAPFVGGNIGDLLIGEDWIFFGKNWYTKGKAINSEFAYRQENLITVGYVNEKCKITDDRKVEVVKKENLAQIEIPEKYNPRTLFSNLPEGFHKDLTRGSAHFSSTGPRASKYLAKNLVSGKFG